MAETAAQKAAAKAKQLAADNAAIARAAAAKGAAAKAAKAKEDAYIASLENPITSPSDPRIAINAGFNPEMVGAMTSTGVAPTPAIEFPKTGKFLKYKPGSKPGFQIPVFADGKGGEFDGEEIAIAPDSGLGTGLKTGLETGLETVEPTLASDVFKQTLAVFFGAAEMAKPWANELYKVVSKFYKTGASAEESFNMALLESETNPAMADFTKRFKGIFALNKMKQAGKAVTVPTIAEYFATESKMGDILKSSNLGDLANEDFLGDVLSKGVSATEFGNRITAIFDRIDMAPDATKKTISRFFPSLDRTQLAKALALGDKGAKQLQQELSGYEVLSAAEQQGLGVSPTLLSGITNEQAQQIARGGGTFESTLPQFGQIARARTTEQKLAEISGVKSLGVTGLTSAVINKSAAELKALEDLTMQEEARFAGKAGNIGSKTFASQSRANRLI
jgi:hypothetical protein